MSFDSQHNPPPQPERDPPKRPDGVSRAEWRRSMKPKCQRVACFKAMAKTSKRRPGPSILSEPIVPFAPWY